jgi:hypothetical protein
LPVWISVASWRESGKSLTDYILEVCLPDIVQAPAAAESERDALLAVFAEGQGWVLLDGVDESDDEPAQVLAAIRDQLRSWITPARVVLTCRVSVWDAGKNALEAFDPYRCLEFAYGEGQAFDQVGQFIAGWFRADPALGARLRAELDHPGRDRIKDQSRNPLRLTLLCMIWQQRSGGALPETLAALYDQYRDAFYEWKQELCPTTSQERKELDQALSRLAFRELEGAGARFRIRHRQVVAELGGPGERLFDMALRVGWLVPGGVASEVVREKVYSFFHPTFQEYFAARAITGPQMFLDHDPDDPAKGCYRAFEARWREVMLIWFGRDDVSDADKDSLLKALTEFDDTYGGYYVYRGLFIASAGVSQFVRATDGDRIVAEVLRLAVGQLIVEEGKRSWTRGPHHLAESAREAIRDCDGERAIELIIWFFENLGEAWDATVAQAAMTCLHHIALRLARASEAGQTCLAILVNLATTAERWLWERALQVLAEIARGDRPTVEALASLLSGVASLEVFTHIVETLRAIADTESLAAALATRARSPAAPDVRAMALVELATLSPTVPSASSALDSILKDGLDSQTTRHLADAVGSGRASDPRILSLAIGVIRSDREWPFKWRLLALGKVGRGNPEVTAFLREIFQTLADPTLSVDDARPLEREVVLEGAASALLMADPACREAFDTLVSIIEHGPVAQSAAAALSGATGAGADLAEIVWFLRHDAIWSLATSGADHPETAATLKRLLAKEANPSVRCELASALARLLPRDADALHALIELLRLGPYWGVDKPALGASMALSEVAPGNPDAVAAAASLITQARSDSERGYGALVLANVGVGSAIARDQLVALLRSTTDEKLRRELFWALVRVAHGSTEHESALLDALGDDALGPMVLLKFRTTLGMASPRTLGMASPRIIEALRLLLTSHPKHPSFNSALFALGSIAGGDARSVTLLTKLLTTEPESELELDSIRRNLIAIVNVTQMPAVVHTLAPFGTSPRSESAADVARFHACQAVLWHCCENLPYRSFAEAFHRGAANH